MNNIKKNFIYNLIYQLLILIIPLIIAPYISRVLGVEGVGIYSFTYSIVSYFMLFVLLGVNNYGNRAIAKIRDNKEGLAKTFWGIYLFQLFMGLCMFFLYLAYIYLFNIEYKNIALLQSMFIVSALGDINWVFFGLEEIKITIFRNVLVKIGTLVLIFLFVKDSNDLVIYVSIMSGMAVFSQLLLWSFVKKRIGFIKVDIKDILQHIKPNLILFIPVVAISLYKIMDKIMLGILSNINEVGFYENAEKIINIPLTIITALGTVLLPRISNLVVKKEHKKINQYIHESILFVMFMSFSMCFGLISVGCNFASLYFGEEFQKTGLLIVFLAPTLLFLSFANILRTLYLIPYEKDKIYILSVFWGALTNLLMNFIFISKYGSVGACLGTIMAEFIVMLYQIFFLKKELNIKRYIIDAVPFFVKALTMFGLIYPLNFLKIENHLKVLLQIILGIMIYSLLNKKYLLYLKKKHN